MQKLAIFDFDGCLVHTLDAWMMSGHETFKNLGLTVTNKDIIDKVFSGDHYGPQDLGVKDIDAFWKDYTDRYQHNIPLVTVHDGAVEALTKLRESGIKVALLSRTERRSVDGVFKLHPELGEQIDFIVTREDVEHHKPHPEGVYKIQEHFGIDSAHTFVIGDTSHDVRAGESAGATSILYYPPYNEPFYSIDEMEALNADHLVHDFKEMLPIMI
jgi:pyrophosphatase PpaX